MKKSLEESHVETQIQKVIQRSVKRQVYKKITSFQDQHRTQLSGLAVTSQRQFMMNSRIFKMFGYFKGTFSLNVKDGRKSY